MKKALITGINGFVGSHLSSYLLKNDFQVFGTIKPGTEKKSQDNIELFDVDMLNFESFKELIGSVAPDHVYHLAALTSPLESFNAPQKTVENNIIGQVNILESVKQNDLKDTKVLVVASAEVYGAIDALQNPINEDTPLRPTSPYAVSKIAQDYFGLQYFLSHGLKTIRVRPFNHIGPRQAPFFAVASFAKQIADIEKGNQEPVIRVGNLDAKRDFTDVRDVVAAYLLLMEKGKYGDVYNIGSGTSRRIGDVLDMLLSLSEAKITKEEDPARMRPSDVPDLVCDNSKIKNETGWIPQISFEDSLKETLDYWRGIV